MFRAYDAERERLVAIKLFKLDLTPERVHQLVGELEQLVAADLNHPAIARPVAAGMSGVAAYLAQDYVAAESLDLAVRQYGPAPAADALRVAAQLAGALDFAAVVDVHHGALHPRDVLLSADDTRLTGLGVARALQRVGVAVPVRRPYTAPELLGGDRNREKAPADLFSFAAVIHELLTGKRLAGAGEAAVAAMPDVPGLDTAKLRVVFARALAAAPEKRYETALAFVEALKDALPQSSVASLQSASQSSVSRSSVSLQSPPSSRLATEDLRPTTTALPFDSPEASDRADVEVPIRAADPMSNFPLAAAEQERYDDVEVGSTAVLGAPEELTPPPALAALPAGALATGDRSGSSVWPLVLALFVGIAVGFAGGYGVGAHDRTTPPTTVAAAGTSPGGREFTDAALPPSREASATDEKPPAAAAPSVPLKPDTAAKVKPDTPAETAAHPGHLLVRSTPAGARVTVDGKDAGVTPSVVRDLAAGAHRVRVSRDGYVAVEHRVVISSARPSQSLTVPLARERGESRAIQRPEAEPATPATTGKFMGTLSVDSRPTGAKVFVDGKLIGTTPLASAPVAAGEHAVRLEYDGYRRWTSSVRVVASEQNRVTASLER